MQFRTLLMALTLTISASFAVADDTNVDAPAPDKDAPKAQSKPAEADDGSKRVVCKLEKPTGSVIPARICKTAAQWQVERENSQRFMQDLQKNTGATHGR